MIDPESSLIYRIEFLENKLREVADMIENESPDVIADTIWYDNTETLCDALRRWAGN